MVSGDDFFYHISIGIIPSMILHVPLYVVPGDEFLATQIKVMWIFTSINLDMLFKVFSDDEFIVTQSTGIWIVLRMALHLSLYMDPGDKTLATWNTVIWNICMFLFRCFLVMNPFPNRAQCYEFGDKVNGPLVKLLEPWKSATGGFRGLGQQGRAE